MKSLLSRKGSVLENAPSFLMRTKAAAPMRFASAASAVEADVQGETQTPPDNEQPAFGDDLRGRLAPRVTPLRPMTRAAQQAASNALQSAQLAEVEWLLQQSALVTFRTFQSFAYSAGLLFYSRELTYYAVLYHDNAVWRVLKATEIEAAESAFRHFVDQATRLADVEMRRAYLEAQNAQLARLLAESDAQVERVRIDLQRGSTHDQEVANRQQNARKELAQLEARRVAAQAQLNKLQRQSQQLDAASNENVPYLPGAR